MKKKILKLVKLYLPDKILNRVRGTKIYEYDRKQFIISASDSSFEKLKFKLLLNTHVLEKGLSHIKIRYGFGIPVLRKLSNNISEWEKMSYSDDNFVYQNCIAALKTYYDLHTEVNHDLSYFKDIFGETITKKIVNYSDAPYGGYHIINPKDKNIGHFSEFALNRYSTREFSRESVSIEEIKDCVKVAQKSPSACNRQSSRVHVITNKSKINKILELQQGYGGYDIPKILLVTTVDTRAYNNVDDRNLGYIDGGLFTMTLIYALEDKLIGACLLNTAFNIRKDLLIREEIGMNPYEIFINLIPVGKMLEETIVANSSRVPVEEILEIH